MDLGYIESKVAIFHFLLGKCGIGSLLSPKQLHTDVLSRELLND